MLVKKMSIAGFATLATLTFATSSSFAQNAAPAATSAVPSPQITLPGGATTLQETFQDWIVTCGLVNGAKVCAASQQQVQRDGQRVLAVEMKPEQDHTRVDVVLPFGILVSEGLSYKIGDSSAEQTKIKTCFPGGCVATFNLNADQLKVLRASNELKMVAQVEDNPQGFTFNVSLKGISQAYDRVVQLVK